MIIFLNGVFIIFNMTIEEDIDYALFHFSDSGVDTAYCILSRFDQAREALENDEVQDLEMFSYVDFMPPTIRTIVTSYLEKDVSKNKARELLDYGRMEADSILKKRGYDASHLFEEEERKIKIVEKQIEEYKILLEILSKEVKKQEELEENTHRKPYKQ